MATLKLRWDRSHTYTLWSWSAGSEHKTAEVVKRISSTIHTARLGLRLEAPSEVVIIKLARGQSAFEKLAREADIYTNELRHMQGTVVPKFYGLYKGKVDGIDLGCMVLEYCSGLPIWDPREFNRQVMIASCKIHQAGLLHGDLMNGRHIIRMGTSVRIIDFSSAIRHACTNSVPTLLGPNYSSDRPGATCCPELVNLERTYGIMTDAPTYSEASIAMARFWCS